MASITRGLAFQLRACRWQQVQLPSTATTTTTTLSMTVRSLATSKVKKEETTTATSLTLDEKKQARKQYRRELFEKQQERLSALPTRRHDRPLKGSKKKAFHGWFLRYSKFQEYHDRKARREQREFRIKVACVLERLPVVTPDTESWETDYEELDAYLSVMHGRRYPADTPFGELTNSSNYTDADADNLVLSTQDLLDSLPRNVRPAPRITLADEQNDTKSLDRKLPHRMFFTNNNNDNNDNNDNNSLLFPTIQLQSDETMVEAAKRVARLNVGEEMELYCAGNCPMAVHMTVYDDNTDTDTDNDSYYGEKTFYIRMQRITGDVQKQAQQEQDYAWLSREEIVEKIEDDQLAKMHHYLL